MTKPFTLMITNGNAGRLLPVPQVETGQNETAPPMFEDRMRARH